MDVRELTVEGVLEFTPRVYHDDRGLFVSPFQGPAFATATAQPRFSVAQSNHSMSRRGVVRGLHFTRTPPGTAKYVYCASGEALDIVVDLRVGSPTFGACDAVLMDQRDFRALYFPVGVGHAFVALRDDTVMSYILSDSYVADNELAISVLDPDLRLPIPGDIETVLSERDSVAMSFAEARKLDLLPHYEQSRKLDGELENSHLSAAR